MDGQDDSYREALAYLYTLQKFGIKFGLNNTAYLLDKLGNPHMGERYVHVGGTNGKGSVCAFLAAMLQEAGLKTGFYSSPHLVRFTERFRIDQREMSRETATGLIEELKRAIGAGELPTFFEAATAMALSYFSREKTDIAVIEVGMGGRLDATNIIAPMVTVITNVTLEHQDYLGKRLLDIAGEKGGIIKKGTPCITGASQSRVLARLASLCGEQGAPLWRLGREFHYRTTPSGLFFKGRRWRLKGLVLGLQGRYQAGNAALALGAAEYLSEAGLPISEEAVRLGLLKAQWPGRLQRVGSRPTILLDGAHNPAALRALRGAIQKGFSYRRLLLVLGVMKDKDIAGCLGEIAPLADHILYTRPVYARAADPAVLKDAAAPFGKPGEVIGTLGEALERAKGLADPEDLILVTGSLFTVGEALSLFDPTGQPPDPAG